MHKTSIEDLRAALAIDEHALEEACAQHADLFYRVSKHLENEISIRDGMKEQLEDLEAKAYIDICAEAEEAETKVTVGEIQARIRLHPEVKRVRDRLLQFKESARQWTALKEAYTQRSYMLKILGELYVSNYYSDVSVGAHVGNAQADRAKRMMQQERVRRR